MHLKKSNFILIDEIFLLTTYVANSIFSFILKKISQDLKSWPHYRIGS